jgi:hypothetical protein
MKASETQIGGNHYKKLAIQPMEYSMANRLDACQHTAVKYITRHADGAGKNDCYKAIHTIMLLIESKYAWEPEDAAVVDAIMAAMRARPVMPNAVDGDGR